MTADPKPRRDGLCALCRRQKRDKVSTSQYGDLSRELSADPFCSTECAKSFHGVTFLSDTLKDDRFDHRDRLKPAA